MTKPTTAQAATVRQLAALGFTEDYRDALHVRMARGNDYRLIRQDGTQKRALGARR
jgi:hypothetical protein